MEKTKIFALITVCVCLLALAGCQNTSDTTLPVDTTVPPDTTTQPTDTEIPTDPYRFLYQDVSSDQ